MLAIGFAGAFRRSELVGIDLEHVARHREGIVITLPRSKTDQEGKGRQSRSRRGGRFDPLQRSTPGSRRPGSPRARSSATSTRAARCSSAD
jgi:hypothetical protein